MYVFCHFQSRPVVTPSVFLFFCNHFADRTSAEEEEEEGGRGREEMTCSSGWIASEADSLYNGFSLPQQHLPSPPSFASLFPSRNAAHLSAISAHLTPQRRCRLYADDRAESESRESRDEISCLSPHSPLMLKVCHHLDC